MNLDIFCSDGHSFYLTLLNLYSYTFEEYFITLAQQTYL